MARKSTPNTGFYSFKLSALVHAALSPDVDMSLDKLLLTMVEYSEDGIKVSFGRKPDKNGYSVAITLPIFDGTMDYICASFWGSDAYSAFEQAYIAFIVLGAVNKGWAYAQAENDKMEASLKTDLAEMIRQRAK